MSFLWRLVSIPFGGIYLVRNVPPTIALVIAGVRFGQFTISLLRNVSLIESIASALCRGLRAQPLGLRAEPQPAHLRAPRVAAMRVPAFPPPPEEVARLGESEDDDASWVTHLDDVSLDDDELAAWTYETERSSTLAKLKSMACRLG